MQDKTVIIWTQEDEESGWNKQSLRADKFPDAVWRVSWNPSGTILAVSCGNNVISLYREKINNNKSEWECISEMNESSQMISLN